MKKSLLDELMEKMRKKYKTDSWEKLYCPKLNKFFREYCKNAPLDRINIYDVNEFLDTFKNNSTNKIAYYNALKSFYKLAYEEYKIPNIMLDIEKPITSTNHHKYIKKNDIVKIKNFIDNDENYLMDRMLLGILLYTGLSRRYIANLKISEISEGKDCFYSIWIKNEKSEFRIPLSKNLEPIIKLYKETNKDISPNTYIFNYSQDEGINARTSLLSKKITDTKYSPTDFSNTFIKLSLSVNPDIYSISKLTLKSVSSIEKHINEITNNDILSIQKNIVDKL